MAGGGNERETVAVKTYVSDHQRDIWRTEATEMGLSLSEYVATRVQEERRDIDFEDEDRYDEDATQGGEALEELVLVALEDGPLEWDDLVQAVYGDLEADLDDALGRLQDANKVHHSGRVGGYTLMEESDE